MDIRLVREDDPVITICVKALISYCDCAGSKYPRDQCIWHWYLSLIYLATKQVLLISPLSSTIKIHDKGNGQYFHTDGQAIPVTVHWNLFIANAPSS